MILGKGGLVEGVGIGSVSTSPSGGTPAADEVVGAVAGLEAAPVGLEAVVAGLDAAVVGLNTAVARL